MNVERLKDKIKESGITMTSLAIQTGISRETLYNRLSNPDFRLSETVELARVLHMTPEERYQIFFGEEVN